jgi:hypothetical protein
MQVICTPQWQTHFSLHPKPSSNVDTVIVQAAVRASGAPRLTVATAQSSELTWAAAPMRSPDHSKAGPAAAQSVWQQLQQVRQAGFAAGRAGHQNAAPHRLAAGMVHWGGGAGRNCGVEVPEGTVACKAADRWRAGRRRRYWQLEWDEQQGAKQWQWGMQQQRTWSSNIGPAAVD